MIAIELKNLGKRYQQEWIFRKLDYRFEAAKVYALLGHNGSGKSTLMQILSGYLSPSMGELLFLEDGKPIDKEQIYSKISIAAPAIELIEELSLAELLAFQTSFFPFLPNFAQGKTQWLERLQLPRTAWNKALRYFSSGMKQRVKLALAIGCDKPVVLLDEPSITLDQAGIDWYAQLLQDFVFQPKRLAIIASNVEADVEACHERLSIEDFKVL